MPVIACWSSTMGPPMAPGAWRTNWPSLAEIEVYRAYVHNAVREAIARARPLARVRPEDPE